VVVDGEVKVEWDRSAEGGAADCCWCWFAARDDDDGG